MKVTVKSDDGSLRVDVEIDTQIRATADDAERIAHAIAAEAEEHPVPCFWWLSFAGEEGCRGVALTGPANGLLSAVTLAHRLGINPHGQVYGIEIPPDVLERIQPADLNRLLTPDEARALDAALSEHQA